MTKKVFTYLLDFLKCAVHFNIILAARLFVVPLFQDNTPGEGRCKRFAYKHKYIKKYLAGKFHKTIKNFKYKKNVIDPSGAENYTVWFLWWQGESSMPPVIRACYASVIKYSNGHNVQLVTKDNFEQFISLPDYILKKRDKKIISLTHFSDILRICLLHEHGGLWLDSTVLLTAPLPPLPPICAHLGFWTPKDDGKILKTCFGAENWIVREGRWLTFCFYSARGSILTEFVSTLFFLYFKKKNLLIDYFLFDYIIAIGYDAFADIRILIDSVPPNNPGVHELQHRLNLDSEYNPVLFGEICASTGFHKLDWKGEHTTTTPNGKLTNYGYIIGGIK